MTEFKEGDKVWLTFKGIILKEQDKDGLVQVFYHISNEEERMEFISPAEGVKIEMREV